MTSICADSSLLGPGHFLTVLNRHLCRNTCGGRSTTLWEIIISHSSVGNLSSEWIAHVHAFEEIIIHRNNAEPISSEGVTIHIISFTVSCKFLIKPVQSSLFFGDILWSRHFRRVFTWFNQSKIHSGHWSITLVRASCDTNSVKHWIEHVFAMATGWNTIVN